MGEKVLIALLRMCIVLYTMFRFALKCDGKQLRFTGQGVEKINDDIKKIIIQRQTNGTQRSMPCKFEK
jgi:hypothetical protein